MIPPSLPVFAIAGNGLSEAERQFTALLLLDPGTDWSKPMNTKMIAALLATFVLAGCASTANNYSAKGILLDNGRYYFPAQDGQGDYYYEEPARIDNGFARISFDSRFGFGAFPPFYGAYSGHACGLRGWGCSPWPYWYSYGRGGAFDPGYRWHWPPGRYDPGYRGHRDRRHGRSPFPPGNEGAAITSSEGRPDAPAIDGLEEDDASPVTRRSQRGIRFPRTNGDEGGAAPVPRQRADRAGNRQMPSREGSRSRIRESDHGDGGQ